LVQVSESVSSFLFFKILDVGDIYNPDQFRFDHHQAGGAGKRENDISYASCGLIWKHFGNIQPCKYNNLQFFSISENSKLQHNIGKDSYNPHSIKLK
jgi:uncharacterized UPF0160 family protein